MDGNCEGVHFPRRRMIRFLFKEGEETRREGGEREKEMQRINHKRLDHGCGYVINFHPIEGKGNGD